MILLIPALIQAPVPLPLVEAKDLPPAPRGPMTPEGPDAGAERGPLGANRRMARHAPSIPSLQAPKESVRIKDQIPDVSGWRSYAVEVPPGGSVKVEVVQGRKAWFKVMGVNRWGRLEEGLLQNRIHRGDPLATYRNPSQETRTIYFIVDTLDASMYGEPFEVEIRRN